MEPRSFPVRSRDMSPMVARLWRSGNELLGWSPFLSQTFPQVSNLDKSCSDRVIGVCSCCPARLECGLRRIDLEDCVRRYGALRPPSKHVKCRSIDVAATQEFGECWERC